MLLKWLVLIALLLAADPALSIETEIPLNWILIKAREAKANSATLDAIATEQNQIPVTVLDPATFLSFYRDTLSLFMRLNPKQQYDFLKLTCPRLQELHLTYAEVLEIVQAAEPTKPPHLLHPNSRSASKPLTRWNDDSDHLTLNQGMLLVLLVNEQAPPNIQALIRSVRLEKHHTNLTAAALFPHFGYFEEREPLARYQLRVYNGILGQLRNLTALSEFLSESANAYYSFEPTPEDMLESARAISVPATVSFYETSRGYSQDKAPKGDDLLLVLRFLRFHLYSQVDAIGVVRYVATAEYYRAEAIRLSAQLDKLISYMNSHSFDSVGRGFKAEFEELLGFLTGEEIYRGLGAFPRGEVNHRNVGEVLLVAEQMENKLELKPDRVSAYLSDTISRATDTASFSTICQRGQVREKADARFADFVSWHPPADLLVQCFGGKTIKAENIAATITPEQFNATLFEDLRVNHWYEPEEMGDFLFAQLPRYLALQQAPSPGQLIAFLRAIPTATGVRVAVDSGRGGGQARIAVRINRSSRSRPSKEDLSRFGAL